MKNEDFKKHVELIFNSKTDAAQKLGFDRDAIKAACCGKTRKGTEYPVPLKMELALAGYHARCKTDFNKSVPPQNAPAKSQVEMYFNSQIRPFTPELWMGEQTQQMKDLIKAWPDAAAVLISIIMGCPIRIDGGDWKSAM